jgi:hypothetical protein
MTGGQGVAGSNPAIPTNFIKKNGPPSRGPFFYCPIVAGIRLAIVPRSAHEVSTLDESVSWRSGQGRSTATPAPPGRASCEIAFSGAAAADAFPYSGMFRW